MSRLDGKPRGGALAGVAACALAAALCASRLQTSGVAAQEKSMRVRDQEIPAGLVPPPGLADAPPLADHAEPPPSPARARGELSPAEPLTRELLDDPPARYRPWTRWWWLGNLVERAELEREVAMFVERGFGGVEIQAFSLGDRVDRRPGKRERILRYDSDEFWGNVRATLDAARRHGLAVDLNHGSGWPAGGPWLGLDDHYQTLAYGTIEVEGGRALELELPPPKVTTGYELTVLLERVFGAEVISFPAEHRRLVAVVVARENATSRMGGGYNADGELVVLDGSETGRTAPVRDAAPGARAAVALDPATVRVLDAEVSGGRLRWRAPEGSWRVIAVYAMPVGEAPSLVAAVEPGLVLDHFDAAKVKAHYDYLFGARTGLDDYWGDPLRGFFNDSLEFKVERHWAAGFLDEFASRRGYRLERWLPILFQSGADNFFVNDVFGVRPEPDFAYGAGDDDARVRWDYEQTVSDLVVERFFDASGEWAAARGLWSRAQGYGMALDAIRAAGRIDLPETEALYAGGSDLFLKLTSSGAHLYGRPLVSAESFVWRGAEYRTTPQKVRAAADKLFTAGVNHLVWHGTPYRVAREEGDGFGDEGWYPWSMPGATLGFSANFSESSPFWRDAADLNRYLARAQLLLRQGRPEADVLVYYPFLRFPSSFGGDAAAAAREDLFNGLLSEVEPEVPPSSMAAFLGDRPDVREDPLVPWLREQQDLLLSLEEAGLTWEWANAEALERSRWRDGGFEIGHGRYGAILIASAPWMPAATAEAVARLAGAGAPVFVAGEPPSRQPGFHDHERGDRRVRAALSGMRRAPDRDRLIAGLRAAVAGTTLVERRRSSPSIRHLGRALGEDRTGGAIVLVRNAGPEPASTEIRLPRSRRPAHFLDGVSGATRVATTDGEGWVRVELAPRDSTFVVAGLDLEPTPEDAWPAKWLMEKEISAPDNTGVQSRKNRLAPSVLERAPSVLERWDLDVEGPDVAGGRLELASAPLFDWRDDPRVRTTSSPGRYRTRLELQAIEPGQRYLLDLGRVMHAADVEVNGEPVATLFYSPFVADVTAALRPGRNTVEVTVRSPLLNRFIGLGDRGDPRYARFAGRPTLRGGLLGPVVLRSIQGPR